MVFCNKSGSQGAEPHVIGQGGPGPDGTGMVPMGGAIPARPRLRRRDIREIQTITENHMLCRPQKLGGFEDHLDHVFVAVPLGGTGRIHRQKEDVHPGCGHIRL